MDRTSQSSWRFAAVNAKPVRCVGYHEACERCQAHMLLEYERLDGFALRAPGVKLRLEMVPMYIIQPSVQSYIV
jgi:hypothetical protein